MSVNLNQPVYAFVWHFDFLGGCKESVTCLVEGLISHSESCTVKFSSKATVLVSQQLPFAAVVAFKLGTFSTISPPGSEAARKDAVIRDYTHDTGIFNKTVHCLYFTHYIPALIL